MDERKKHGWPFWFVVALIALPVLYLASSGPALMIARTRVFVASPSSSAVPTAPGSPIGTEAELVETVDDWWRTVYSPLDGAADHPWGEPLSWYWDLF